MSAIKITLKEQDHDDIKVAAVRLGVSVAAFVRLAALKLARENG